MPLPTDAPEKVTTDPMDRFHEHHCPEHGRYWTSLEADPGCPDCAMPDEVRTAERDEVLHALHGAGVNVHAYRDATLEGFDGTHDPEVLPAVRRWLAEWDGGAWHPRPWLYLYGDGSDEGKIGRTGNGKTHIAVAILRHLLETGKIGSSHLEFVTAEEILIRVEDCRSESRAILPEIKRLGKLPIVVVDDLGVRSHWSDNTVRVLVELARLRESKATIWTSNLSLRTLGDASDTLRRLVSRISGEVRGDEYAVRFTGPDRRITKGT